jgi:hypothetical protein
MNIKQTLQTKPNNQHHLNRYFNFIQWCQESNKLLDNGVSMEKHHICPKAKDLFPEYQNFNRNKWNRVDLTVRQHVLAHVMLWKAYGGSQALALDYMLDFYNSKYNINLKHRKIPESIKVRYLAKVKEEYRLMTIGKVWFHNPTTGVLTQILKTQSPPVGFLPGHGSLLKRTRKYKMYNDGKTQITITNGDPIPEGFVNGLLKDQLYYDMLKRKSPVILTEEQKMKSANRLLSPRLGKIKYYNESTDTVKYFVEGEQPEGWRIGANRGHINGPQTEGQKNTAKTSNQAIQEVWLKSGEYLKFDNFADLLDHFKMDRNHIYHKEVDRILLEKYGITKLIRHKKNSQK